MVADMRARTLVRHTLKARKGLAELPAGQPRQPTTSFTTRLKVVGRAVS